MLQPRKLPSPNDVLGQSNKLPSPSDILKKKDISVSNIPQPQQTGTMVSPSEDGSLATQKPTNKPKTIGDLLGIDPNSDVMKAGHWLNSVMNQGTFETMKFADNIIVSARKALQEQGFFDDDIPDTDAPISDAVKNKVFSQNEIRTDKYQDPGIPDPMPILKGIAKLGLKVVNSTLPQDKKNAIIAALNLGDQTIKRGMRQLDTYQEKHAPRAVIANDVLRNISGIAPELTLAVAMDNPAAAEGSIARSATQVTENAKPLIQKYLPKATKFIEEAVRAPFTKIMAAKGTAEGVATAKEGEDIVEAGAQGGLEGVKEGIIMHGLGVIAGKTMPYIAKVISKTGVNSAIATGIANPLANAGVFATAKAIRKPIETGEFATEKELISEAATGIGFSLLHAGTLAKNHNELNHYADNVLKNDEIESFKRVANETKENLDLVYNPDLTPEDVSKLETVRDEMKSVIIKEPDLNNKQLLINEALKIQNQLDAHSAINNIVEHKEAIIDKINSDEDVPENEKEFYTKKIAAIADHFDNSEFGLKKKELNTRIDEAQKKLDDASMSFTNLKKPSDRIQAKIEVEKRRQEVEDLNNELTDLITNKVNENAVQEPTTDESVLRTEQPQLELQGVGEGNTQPEGVAKEETIINEKPEEVVPAEEPRIKDSQIPLKRETFESETDSGNPLTVEVTTNKDGSRNIVTKVDGEVTGGEIISKDNTLPTNEYISGAYGEIKGKPVVEEGVEIMTPAMKEKLTPEQKTELGIEEVAPITEEVVVETKPTQTVDEAIKTLQESKEYVEADDIQKENLVRATRKEFGLKEKAAPSVNRLFGKLKDISKITITEKAGLVKQIKDLARGAKDAKIAIKNATKELAAEVGELKKSGKITVNQLNTIMNRFSKVNVLSETSVSKFTDYIDKVFKDANYAKTISEIKKLQRQAKSRNHTSMTNVVKEFTSINPELIPLDRIQDYIEALDFLNNRTPSYSKMNDILSEIDSYKEVDEFDAVKTMDALEKKYEKIELNKLKSVEEYVSLIRDINSFKRKAYQLLQEDSITQEEYDNLINRVGNDQDAVEKKYEKEINQLKSNLINEIKSKRPKVNSDFSNEENDLIKKYLTLSDSDLKSLSPENLFILNDILENIGNGEIDYYRFNDVISRAFTNDGVNQLAKQIEDSKFNMSSERGRQKLSEQESAFWEGLLGMGRVKSGALQKFVISTFNRAIGSYENFIKNGYNEFLTLKKKYNIKDNEMHKIGILTTYLQEYMAQFDSKNKGIDSIGKRDWFKEILNNIGMKDNYSSGKPSVLKMIGFGSSEIEIIQKIWDKLPKDKNGEVNPKDVYESYIANDGKFFNKNEKSFFDDVMKYKESTITPKQKAANELSGNSFKEVPFHMLRVRLDSGKKQIQPSVSSENGTVRIKANTGKERINEKVGPVMTNFEKLFISNIEQTGRDYFLSGSLKDINNTLSGVKKIVNKDKMPLLNTISYGLSDALDFEFDRVKNNLIFKNLLSARAATALLNPIRTGVELISTLVSYPIRAKDFSGYYSLFNEQGIMKKLLEFTNSPMLLRENISKAIDINDGSIKPQSKLNKATNYLSGLPERTMMVTSWMPSFKSEFKNITDIEFDIDKFNSNKLYREKYSKAIIKSASVADAQTEKIVGPTTKAAQRREVRIAPRFLANIFGSEGTVSKKTATGQILGFFSNYPFRESTEFINGFKEAAEVLKDEGALSSLSQLQKPLGIALNIASYGFFSTASYALSLMLLGGDDDEKRGKEILDDLMTADGFLSELASNAISLAGSQYAAGGKAMLQMAATIGIMSANKKEDKDKIKKLLKDSVFVNPLPIEQTTKFGGKDKALASIGMYIPQFVILADRFTEAIGSAKDIKLIYDKVEKDGIKSLTEDEKLKILALNTLFNATQLMLNLRGTSIPEYNKLKIYMNGIKEGGGVSREELKKSDPEMYKIMYEDN